jgi:GxxExxY protein
MSELIYKEECFRIVGACIEVHRELGKGHNENIYKDALQLELNARGIGFIREHPYTVSYKGSVLPHSYCADFVVLNQILLEAKAVEQLTDSHIKQVLNYLAASKLKLGVLVNFGQDSLTRKRVILTASNIEQIDLQKFSRKLA